MSAPRIALIHALRDSMQPIWDAFADTWPDVHTFNLLDDSLSADRAAAGALTDAIADRFLTLGRYARDTGVGHGKTDAILFTCSAFGPAIEAVKRDLDIPVLSPNESAFEEALLFEGEVGLIVTFPPSEASLTAELETAIEQSGKRLAVKSAVADGALPALQAGDGGQHDTLIAEAARSLGDVSCVVLGQFSMARARAAVEAVTDVPVVTTPAAAVARLRALLSPSSEQAGAS